MTPMILRYQLILTMYDFKRVYYSASNELYKLKIKKLTEIANNHD